jgi:pimeloyl-ACP methyl ester carboxylesterase
MSFSALLDVLLQIESFRNIDLPQQGLYCLKAELKGRDYTQSVALHTHRRSGSVSEVYNLKPPVTSDSAFYSSWFLIRYMDEVADLGQVYTFRVEIPIPSPDFSLELVFTLYHHDMDLTTTVERSRHYSRQLGIQDMTEVTSTTLTVQDYLTGIHEFVNVVFPEPYFSCIRATLHTTLVDFKASLGRTGEEDILVVWQRRLFSGKVTSEQDIGLAFSEYNFPLASSLFALTEYLNCLKRAVNHHKVAHIVLPQLLDVGVEFLTDWTPSALKSQMIQTYARSSAYETTQALVELNGKLAGHIFQLVHCLREFLVEGVSPLSQWMNRLMLAKIRARYTAFVIRSTSKVNDFPLFEVPFNLAAVKRIRGDLREVDEYITDDSHFADLAAHPLLFESSFVTRQSNKSTVITDQSEEVWMRGGEEAVPGLHLVFLVHGFQGSPFDMRRLRNYLKVVHPDVVVHCSQSNEGSTEGSIDAMGERLATEVLLYIEEWVRSDLTKVSFIGHSIGGLIIRAALPRLEALKHKMHALVTLSTPHLGFMYHTSKWVDVGFKFLRHWNKSVCLSQLAMRDKSDIRESFIFKLCSYPGIGWFRHVILFSSHQDHYAPRDTARIEVPERASKDALKGNALIQMASNLLSQITAAKLTRIDVDFPLPAKTIDSMIGRAAHIQFIDNHLWVLEFLYSYPELFA